MKLTNLILHLITGYSLTRLFRRLFLRDPNLSSYAEIAAVLAAGLWIILPQHIATVFYLVQRMTILSTLFAVLACWMYVVARERMEQRRTRGLHLMIGVAGMGLLSVLSKESGLLLPIYCFLIECIYFQASAENPRSKVIVWAFRIGLFLPGLLVATYLSLTPSFVLHGYQDRAFSVTERMMTQLRVMADYFSSTFMPMVRSSGVYNDDFPIVSSLGTTEYLIVLAAIVLIAAAIRMHKTYPSFSFGIGLFFCGHLLESTIFPLEMYFAHRNYLPSIGLVIAMFGLISGYFNRHQAIAASLRRMIPLAFTVLLLGYAAASFSRARLWSDYGTLMTHAQIHHPDSMRMRSEILLNSLSAKRLDIALQQADIAIRTAKPAEKRTIQLWRILAYCYTQTPQPDSELVALYNMPADRITMATSTALDYVSAAAEANACPGLDRQKLGHLVNLWAVNTIQYPWEPYVWRTHLAAARLLASSGDFEAGFKQALWAFNDSGHNFDAGLLAYQLANSLEDRKNAAEVLSLMYAGKSGYTESQQLQLQALRGP